VAVFDWKVRRTTMAKKKQDTNGATTLPGGWAAAAEASAAKDRPAPVQTRLDLGRDVCTVYEHHDLEVPVSGDEADLLNASAASALAKAEAKQKEVDDRKEKLIKPLEAEIKDLRKEAAKNATEAAERKRTQSVRLRVEYHPSTATVYFFHPETGREVKVSRAMTAKELENYSLAADPSPERVDLEPDGEPEDAESAS
jgi:hypothetical protein